jgi:hypothetical protein
MAQPVVAKAGLLIYTIKVQAVSMFRMGTDRKSIGKEEWS